jgi:short-subunit dehydrogenase
MDGARAIGPVLSPGEVARSIGRIAHATAAPLLPRRSLEAAVGGRVVVMTGASYGIGHAAALQIAAAGATTILVARGAEQLDELAGQIEQAGGTAHTYVTDLSDMKAIDALVVRLDADGHEVDVLVNNAARSIRRSIAQSYDRFHDYERTMQLNYFGAVRLTLAVLPGMRARRRGHVVNVSTLGTQTSTPRYSAYLASKAALEAFTRVAAAECLGDDVRFTTVHMPLVRTPMSQATKLYDAVPAMSPEAAGELLCGAICSRAEQVGPRVGAWAEVGHAISPASANEVLHTLYRAIPEPS